MKYPLLGKAMALFAVIVALMLGLNSIDDIVQERQRNQREAERSVEEASARQQTLLGPVLRRHCHEAWQRVEDEDGMGKRKLVSESRDFVLTAWPHKLDVVANAGIQPRHRGLFKLNSYLAKTAVTAEWPHLNGLQPRAEHPGGQVRCEAPIVAVALSDARGIQSATVQAGALNLPVLPGSRLKKRAQGFHAVLADRETALGEPLRLQIALTLTGTRSLAWVPVGDETRVQLSSEWPHPSFAGRFLPVERQVKSDGFLAQWQVSALATTAQQAMQGSAAMCDMQVLARGEGASEDGPPAGCLDSFGVSFIDPVNSYVLSDRALKYGLLFIGLTFVGVGLVEIMRRVRVHPVQYLLVGCALTLFFLLLLSLAEHVAFGWAYLCASLACSALLTFYAHHILQGWRAGLVFGTLLGLLYAALYGLLQMEQTAMVLGALLLFTVLTALMVATRHLDWYALTAQMREASASSKNPPNDVETGFADLMKIKPTSAPPA